MTLSYVKYWKYIQMSDFIENKTFCYNIDSLKTCKQLQTFTLTELVMSYFDPF